MGSYALLGIDVGTTACKAVVLKGGRIAGLGSSSYALNTPDPFRAEQNPREVWEGVVNAVREALARARCRRVDALSLSGAMHTLLPVGTDMSPLSSAWSWADARCLPYLQSLRKELDLEALYRRTGCPLQAPYNLPRLVWLREERPELFRQAACFLALKDFLLWRMTGQLRTDLGLASTTGLLNLHSRDWDEEALSVAAITADRLPPLVPSDEVVGNLKGQVAEEFGLSAPAPVVAGGADGGLANLGVGAGRPGRAVVTIGTSGAVRLTVDAPFFDRDQRTWCYILDEELWYAGGAINNGGLLLQWIRELLAPGAPYEELLEEAGQVPPGAKGVFFLPYIAGERSPFWDPRASGALLGLRREHDRPCLIRAALEGVCFAIADVVSALREAGASLGEFRITGGFARHPLWPQILADVLGARLLEVETTEASAMGAAFLAMRGLGFVSHWGETENLIGIRRVFEPDAENHQLYRELHRQFRELSRLYREGRYGGENLQTVRPHR